MSRIRRKAYQYLYSVSSIHELLETRIRWALELSEELRGLINQTRIEVSVYLTVYEDMKIELTCAGDTKSRSAEY